MLLADAIKGQLAKQGHYVPETDTTIVPQAVLIAEDARRRGAPVKIAVAFAVNQVTADSKARQYSRFLVHSS